MIDYVDDMFTVPRELQSSLYQLIRESNGEALDGVLNRLYCTTLAQKDACVF